MIKLKDYVNKKAVIYENTPMFEFGAIVEILDYDSISKGEVSFLVTENSSVDSQSHTLSVEKWVKLSDIKQIISYTRPKEYKFITKIKGYIKEAWIRISKIS